MNFQEKITIHHHGPTTIFFRSRGVVPTPAERKHTINVRVSPLTPASPYVIEVQNAAAVRRLTESFPTLHVNLLRGSRIRPTKFDPYEEQALTLSPEEFYILFDDGIGLAEAPEPEIFVRRRHPFHLRSVMVFTTLAVLVILPIALWNGGKALQSTAQAAIAETKQGVQFLKDARGAIRANRAIDAVKKFEAAEQAFSEAASLTQINEAVKLVASAIPEGKAAVLGTQVIQASQNLSAAARSLTEAATYLNGEHKPTEKIGAIENGIVDAIPALSRAQAALINVDTRSLPLELPIESLSHLLNSANTELPRLSRALHLAKTMLGDTEKRRYLLVFQNSNELRPTGGFIGSFALVDFNKGEIANFEMPADGSYNLQGQLKLSVAAPTPLRVVSPKWQFHDANWFPDFPTSAPKLVEFYEASGGPTVDGVISVNSSLMSKLLGVTGELPIPGFDESVNSENFQATAERLAETDYSKTKTAPKEFLKALAPKVLESLSKLNSDQTMQVGEIFSRALSSKELQMWSRAPEEASALHEFGWDGSQTVTDGDYLAVVNANIAGGKTDGVIEERIEDETTINDDGSLTKSVQLIRTHRGKKEDLLSGAKNQTFHRFYVPTGSTILNAHGFSVMDIGRLGSIEGLNQDKLVATQAGTKQDAKTGLLIGHEGIYETFGGWTEVEAGGTVIARITYRVPKLVTFERRTLMGFLLGAPNLSLYSYVFDHQSGTSREISHLVNYPRAWKLLWKDKNWKSERNALVMEEKDSEGLVNAVLFEK